MNLKPIEWVKMNKDHYEGFVSVRKIYDLVRIDETWFIKGLNITGMQEVDFKTAQAHAEGLLRQYVKSFIE